MDESIGALITLFVIAALFIIVMLGCFGEIGYVAQNEIGFAYNVSDGKPVNEKNNPLLSMGWHITWGWDSKFFIINSEVNRWNFTADTKDPKSPFDESATGDSYEGTTMQVDLTVMGRVTDPWQFYANYGRPQQSYSDIEGIKDENIYRALRRATQFVRIKMCELTQSVSADEIRRNPGGYAETLTKEAVNYSENFGFTITDVLFPVRFLFPGGTAIEDARNRLQNANSDWENKKKEVKIAQGKKDEAIANAKIQAKEITGTGARKADELLSEAHDLAEQLKTSIDQVGVDAAMQLKMAELQSELTKEGVISRVILTSTSLI